MLAISELLVAAALEIEQCFKIVQLTGLIFKLACFFVELGDLIVSAVNNFRRALSDVIRKSILEFDSEFLYKNTESSQTTLDVLGLLVLEGKNAFLYWAKCFFGYFLKLTLSRF